MTSHAHADLEPHERQLSGRWNAEVANGVGDVVDARIFWLVTERLTPTARSFDGWDAVFFDSRDGRFWELTFPHGSLFAGGPRQLTLVSPDVVAEKYGRSALG